jgi:vancomycin permeability regulator SanA
VARPAGRTIRSSVVTISKRVRSVLRYRFTRLLLAATCAAVAAVPGLRLVTMWRYHDATYVEQSVPARPVAVVFGAGVGPSGYPSPILEDRVLMAAELYRLGKVERLLLTGDGRNGDWGEPAAMRRLALDSGVPDSALTLDQEGFRTRASCERARDTFGVERAVLITQSFHLPRAMLLCDSAGIDVAGVASDQHDFGWRRNFEWQTRETAATVVAWWEVVAPW